MPLAAAYRASAPSDEGTKDLGSGIAGRQQQRRVLFAGTWWVPIQTSCLPEAAGRRLRRSRAVLSRATGRRSVSTGPPWVCARPAEVPSAWRPGRAAISAARRTRSLPGAQRQLRKGTVQMTETTGTADNGTQHGTETADALVDSTPAQSAGRAMIAVELLTAHPGNVRRDISLDKEFLGSIAELGILTPLRITPDGAGSYRMIEGHRRLAAAEKLGMPGCPTISRPTGRATRPGGSSICTRLTTTTRGLLRWRRRNACAQLRLGSAQSRGVTGSSRAEGPAGPLGGPRVPASPGW